MVKAIAGSKAVEDSNTIVISNACVHMVSKDTIITCIVNIFYSFIYGYLQWIRLNNIICYNKKLKIKLFIYFIM